MTIGLVFLIVALGATWLGYPLLLAVWPRRRSIPPRVADGPEGRCAIVIAAFDEEAVIEARLRNLAEVKLPEGTEVLLGGDGCTDRTMDIAREWAGRIPALQLFDFKERRGKPAVLKDLVSRTAADYLVFTDANTIFADDAVAHLLAPFVDAEIGGTCGQLVLTSADSETRENAYWRWETWLKVRESRIDSCLGANGALYAVRRSLFWEKLPDTTIVDDFVIGMKVREQGHRMVYVPDAIAREEQPERIADEHGRRVRIGAGDFQALWLCRGCLHPRMGTFAILFLFHKVLRWLTPHLMGALLLLTLAGAWTLAVPGFAGGNRIWTWSAIGQVFFYSLAALGRWQRQSRHRWMVLPHLCDYFVAMQYAPLRGIGSLAARRAGSDMESDGAPVPSCQPKDRELASMLQKSRCFWQARGQVKEASPYS